MPIRGRSNLSSETYFFVTTTVVDFLDVFSNDRCCDALVKNIKHYQEKYKFEILAYVIMPSHFHWIVEVNPASGSISDIMRDIKKYSAWDVMELLEHENRYDLISLFEKHAVEYKDRKRKFWMKRFDDQVIRDSKMFWTKLNYIHLNPVESGLVEKPELYKYSSARNYSKGDHSVIKVNTNKGGIILK
ncbi:MAG: hypothetical protein FJ213_11050 [Ignavibacteria bacterium]|nr:hypothetical protein [Ignavibacteria bacterium]